MIKERGGAFGLQLLILSAGEFLDVKCLKNAMLFFVKL